MLASAHNSRLARAVRMALGTASISMVALWLRRPRQPATTPDVELEVVTITGFRSSLDLALTDKRNAIGAVDSIRAEDIVDFPDLNLAESIQRIPGVALARDAGEGRHHLGARPVTRIHPCTAQWHRSDVGQRRNRRGRRHQSWPRLRLQHLRL